MGKFPRREVTQMAKSKKSAREVSPRDVTGVPGSAGGSPNAGVVKRVVKGGGTTKGLGGGKPESKPESK
jgi:hypothetical protein